MGNRISLAGGKGKQYIDQTFAEQRARALISDMSDEKREMILQKQWEQINGDSRRTQGQNNR